jgi:tRNA pseudouridine38-40 synthase
VKILLTVEYDGTDFSGWQIQPGRVTVQGALTDALSDLLKTKIVLRASGRTDAGVHALRQKANFSYNGNFPVGKIALAVNTRLPENVRVLDARKVPDSFDAQFDAKKKTYVYRFYLSTIIRPLTDRYACRVPYDAEKFDFEAAENAVKDLVGTHDFIGFSSTGRPVGNSVRTIYDARLTQKDGAAELTVTGSGFLYNMMRIIAGTVVKIGLRQLPPTAVKDVIESGDRTKGGTTFPARGLTLFSVEYDNL